jgi:hypothetical protein
LSCGSAVDRLGRLGHQVLLIHESFFLFVVCGCPVVESCSVGGSDRFGVSNKTVCGRRAVGVLRGDLAPLFMPKFDRAGSEDLLRLFAVSPSL